MAGGAAAQGGVCPAPSIDGSLQDMINYANCPDLVGCGLVQTDDPQDVCSDEIFDSCQNNLRIPCPAPPEGLVQQIYFPNGADIVTAVSAYDASSNTLYLGMRTVFAIGDADGDNDAGTNPANCDGTNITEQPGIGAQEAYNFFIDTNCDEIPDITVEIASNGVTVSPPAGATSISFNGTDLEVSVANIQLPPVYCFQGFAGFTFDGLAEDQTMPLCCGQPTPQIQVALNCPGNICPGATENITATVTNLGDTPLTDVALTIPLPANLNFTSFVDEGTWDSCNEAAGTITCTESNLPLFGTRVVTFSVTAKPDCGGTNTVPATVVGTFSQPGCVEESGVQHNTSCDITCTSPPCEVTGDNMICLGETTQFCAPAGQASYAWTGPGGFTANTQCITVSVAGEYCVTVTDVNGCISRCCRTLTVNPPPPCDVTGDNVICQGETTQFCAPAGMASYAWTGPGGFTANTQCITIGVAGEYSVTITDANGCVSTCSRTLTVNPPPPCDITGDNVICQGETTQFCAPASMASYAWTGPGGFTASTQCVTISVAGEYSVTITDANGCVSTCSRTLTVNPPPPCDVTGDNAICQGETTQFCAPAGMASYAWTGPGGFTASTQCITISAAGEYCVTITDNNGCVSSCCRTLTVNPPPPCNVTGDNAICQDETTEFCAPPGMASYAWTGPGGFTANTQCITIGVAGEYNVTITDGNGCVSSCSRTLTVNPPPPCDVTGDDAICEGQTTQFCAPAGMASYAWTGPGGFTASTQCITIGAGGEYCVTVTDANGCASHCCRTLTVNPPPPCDVTGDNVICQGETTQFCAPAGMASYAWTGPGGFTANTQCITISVAGQYTVTITDGNGCVSTCSRTLTVNPPPPCNVTGDDVICQGETTQFCAPAGMASYAWTGPGGYTANTQCITISVAGQYNVTITDNNGCVSSCSRTLTVNPPPPCNVTGDNVICQGETTQFCAPAGMASYAWTGPGGYTANTQCITISAAGEYCVRITDNNGCVSTCCRTLTVNPPPPCNVTGDNTICQGETTQFCAPAGMAGYAWTGPGGFTANTQCITVSVAGQYNVTITDNNGCVSTCSRTLTVNPAPVCAITGNNEICQGRTTQFCAPAGMASYAWTGPGGFTASTQCITIGVAGQYNVTITDANGCVSNCSRTLTVTPPPVCGITGDNRICHGETTHLCATEGMFAYRWTGPGGFTARTQCIDVSLPGQYCVAILDKNHCESQCCVTLTVDQPPHCVITGDSLVCTGETGELCATPGMASYSWTGPGGFTASTQCITYDVAGEYIVTITDQNGCRSHCSIGVKVQEPAPCYIKVETNPICEGETTELCGADGFESYEWTGPGGFTANTQCITVGQAGVYELTVLDHNGCSDTCELELIVEQCEPACPRTVGFWTQQCHCADGEGGNVKFSCSEMDAITDCIASYSDFFNGAWGDNFDGFCATIDPPRPMRQRKQAKRQFAGMLANVCAGELGIPANNGDIVSLPLDTPVTGACAGLFDAETIGELIPEIDALLIALENQDQGDPDVLGKYTDIITCADRINNGIGIPFDPERCVEPGGDAQAAFADQGLMDMQTLVDEAAVFEGFKEPTPNPFRDVTRLAYAVPGNASLQVEISIYNAAGQRVRTLVNGAKTAGRHEAIWDGRRDDGEAAPAGVYFYRAAIAGQTHVSRVVLMR